ncbi:sensor histidine kinase [Runella sp.]|uniref:sensor histidine kinase n=1 Tax=Runella sp. TaxID=1960881 RepID=UPI003D0979AC
MKKAIHFLTHFFLAHTEWAFGAIIFWLSIGSANEKPASGWAIYFITIGILSVFLAPVLALEWKKMTLKKRLSTAQYGLIWILCYSVYLPCTAWLLSQYPQIPVRENMFWEALLYSVLLSIALEINAFIEKRSENIEWIRRLSVEKAIIFTLLLLAITLSAMAVSSLDDPRFHTQEQLLIGFVFSFEKLIRHFGLFLSFSLQLFLMYMAGYLCFVLNRYFLVSVILKKKGVLIYGLALLTTTAAIYPILAQLLLWLPINTTFGKVFPDNPFQFENGMGVLGIMLISLPIVLAIQWFNQNNQITNLEKEKMQAELDLLKQQINPHFFFNTLNNLYALSLEKSDKAPEAILQLSELMRYVIYQGNQPRVAIGQEIKYLEDYIELQRLRLTVDLNVTFEKSIDDEQRQISPLLLIIFVENAFKHGIEQAENPGFLFLSLSSNRNCLTFTCINSFEETAIQKDGIGLKNVRKRLALLYPDKHILIIEKEEGVFKAELTLYYVLERKF